jgi:hypothetical protein
MIPLTYFWDSVDFAELLGDRLEKNKQVILKTPPAL